MQQQCRADDDEVEHGVELEALDATEEVPGDEALVEELRMRGAREGQESKT